MKVDYIRRDIPEEISEEGGAFIQLVGKNTVGLQSSIKEAIAHLYCVGEPSLIEGYFKAIMRSVFEGIQADGHPRSVGDVQFYPVCGGQFDLDKGWDPLVNDVRIKARLVNGVTLDVSDWTFRDVTVGRVAFTVSRVSDGTTDGVVTSNKDVEINGANFPAKSDLTVSWSCGTKGGDVAADKFTATVSRITIDKTAIASLTATENGMPFEVTVKGCYNKATKKAVYAHVTPPAPTVTKVKQDGQADNDIQLLESTQYDITGTNLNLGAADKLYFARYENGEKVEEVEQTSCKGAVTATSIHMNGINNAGMGDAWYNASEGGTRLIVVKDGQSVEHNVYFRP